MKNKLLNFFNDNKKLVIVGAVLVVIFIGYFYNKSNDSEVGQDIFKEEKIKKKSNVHQPKENKDTNQIIVDIQGAIKHPGVYKLNKSSRVFDVIQLASGLLENADRKNINQAKKITDQEKIYIPIKGEVPDEKIKEDTVSNNQDVASDKSSQVNINAATVDDLQKLSGIGPKKAEQIIAYREENGGFEKVEDLTKVTGIGDKTLESLKSEITV